MKNKIIYKGIGVMSFYIFIYKCKEIYISCYLGVKLLSSQISDWYLQEHSSQRTFAMCPENHFIYL